MVFSSGKALTSASYSNEKIITIPFYVSYFLFLVERYQFLETQGPT